MAKKKGVMDFPGLVGNGENSKGFRALTPDCNENGEGGAPYQQYPNWDGNVNGDRFNQFGDDPERFNLSAVPAVTKGRRK